MKKDNKKNWLLIGGILLVLLIIILYILMNGRETKISDDGESESVSALVCTDGNREGAFFYSTTANTVTNEIKVTFKKGQFDKLFYTYRGVYRSEEVANEEEAEFHADYNIYMGHHDLNQNSLNPAYSVPGNKLVLSLYTDDYSKINRLTSEFFFISPDDIEKYKNYSLDEMKDYYENKDFACQIVK